MKRTTKLSLGFGMIFLFCAMAMPLALYEDYCMTGGGSQNEGTCKVTVANVPVEGGEHEGVPADVLRCDFDVVRGAPGTVLNCSGNAMSPIFY